MSILSEPHFHSEAAAITRLESLLWPNGPVCPRCKGRDRITPVKGGRAGLWRCGPCKRQFTVKVGTVFESSHVKLHLWFQAAHLLASSKKGISAHQLHRTLKVSYKTAWFMEHRLREAMRTGSLYPLGGTGKAVEADETFMSHMEGRPRGRRGTTDKRKVLTLVERGGNARSFHVRDLRVDIVAPIVRENIARESILMTDEARHYRNLGKEFAEHHAVEHNAKEYVRGEAHVNVEARHVLAGWARPLARGWVEEVEPETPTRGALVPRITYSTLGSGTSRNWGGSNPALFFCILQRHPTGVTSPESLDLECTQCTLRRKRVLLCRVNVPQVDDSILAPRGTGN